MRDRHCKAPPTAAQDKSYTMIRNDGATSTTA